MTEEQKKLVSYTHEELVKKRRRTNDSLALWMLSGFSLIAAVSNQTFLVVMYEGDSGPIKQLLITICLLLLCVASGIYAVIMIRKPATSLAEDIGNVGEEGLYTAEDICDYYREVRENRDNLIYLFGNDKIDETNKHLAGVFTENWMKVHENKNIVKKSDIVAAWHNIDHDGTEFTGLYLLRIDGEQIMTKCSQEFSDKILAEIEKRNPLTFLARCFIYEEKQYDVLVNKEPVIALYKRILENCSNQT